MTDTRTLSARLDMLEAAVVALAATVPADRATIARALFLVAFAERDEGRRAAEADAAGAGTMAVVLRAFDGSVRADT